MRDRPLVMTDSDVRRLRGLLVAGAGFNHDHEHLKELEVELERALVLGADEVPTDAVMLRSRVRVLDLTSGERHEFLLVLPAAANVSAHRISVLAPLGTALLGQRQGDEVEWLMPGGWRKLRIERVSRETDAAAVGGLSASPALEAGDRDGARLKSWGEERFDSRLHRVNR